MALLARIRLNPYTASRSIRLARSFASETNVGSSGGPHLGQDDEQIKQNILNNALNHVNSKGWTRNAIKAGAEELNISGEISNMFTEYDLVKHFMERSNDELESHLEQNKLNLQEALQYRLEKVVPYVPRFNEALAHTTQPPNLPKSVKILQSLADIVAHHALQDKSTDLSWYAKRMGVASIYVASELHLVQDNSENYKETWDFLRRRCDDFGKVVEKGTVLPFANALPEVLNIGFTTIMNMLGKNKPR